MSRILFVSCLLTMVAMTGCESPQAHRRHIPSEVKVDAPTEGRPTLGAPIQLPESEVFVVPFTMDRPKHWLEDSDQFTTGKYSTATQSYSPAPQSGLFAGGRYEGEPSNRAGLSRSVRWHNAVVCQDGAAGKLVLDRRGLISRIEVLGPWVEVRNPDRKQDEPIEYRFEPKAVLMLATLTDTNKDGQLTSEDANVLIAGDPNADDLHPITPPDTQVWSTGYNDKLNLILIMVASDSNGDGLFSVADSAAPYIYTPGDDGPAKPLVEPSLTEQAERLLK